MSFNKQIALEFANDGDLKNFIHTEVVNRPVEKNFENEYNMYNICKQIVWNIKEAREDEKKRNDQLAKEKEKAEEEKRASEEDSSEKKAEKMVEEKRIEDKKKEKNAEEKNENKKSTSDSGPIMISCNTDSRSLCLQIKADLEASGYKVRMDVGDLLSSVDSVAKAIEEASLVLMCVTEKYRQSLNSQSEAQHAYKCGIPIIPCIMQPGAESITGWLGVIMGDRASIHFLKNEFAVSMGILKDKVDVYYKAPKTIPNSSSVPSIQPAAPPPAQSPATSQPAATQQQAAPKTTSQSKKSTSKAAAPPVAVPRPVSKKPTPQPASTQPQPSAAQPMPQNQPKKSTQKPVVQATESALHQLQPANANLPAKNMSNDQPLKWNTSQVEEWFKNNEQNMDIHNQLKPCDGQLLNQL
jgi:hypothetical protein